MDSQCIISLVIDSWQALQDFNELLDLMLTLLERPSIDAQGLQGLLIEAFILQHFLSCEPLIPMKDRLSQISSLILRNAFMAVDATAALRDIQIAAGDPIAFPFIAVVPALE